MSVEHDIIDGLYAEIKGLKKKLRKSYSVKKLHKLADEFCEVDKTWESDYKGAFNFIEWLKEREKK